MDGAENVIMEDVGRIQESNDNEIICLEGNVMQKSSIDELKFGAEDGYSVHTDTAEIAHAESGPLERDALLTKDQEEKEVAVDKAYSHFCGEFGDNSLNIQENQCNDEINAENSVADLAKPSIEISENKVGETINDGLETAETRSIYGSGKPHFQGPKHHVPPGWIYHGESDGYRYYIGCAGEMYSVDRDGYWYMQDSGGNFVPYNSYQYNRGAPSSLFPRDSQGRFILPTNARGEKAFPVDTNNMPIFPFDATTHLPTFPVDENGQPVFPTGVLGRPVVPVDTNGLAIFPRDANGRFIFPSGTNGKPTAPVNIYGVPVMPLDEQGKPVVPYDASGTPLIHLASDGMTPLTEEEYQYSLQWNDYYSRYYMNTPEQKVGNSNHSAAQQTSTDTYEQKAKNMKLLKKVRPEDIDLPPCVPPPPSTQPPPPVSDGSVSSGEMEKKTNPDPALKAKTKKMIEMQLKFSRKKLRDSVHPSVPILPSNETTNISADHAVSLQQPSDSLENIKKVESPKKRPPPPIHALKSFSSLPIESDNMEIRESYNAINGKHSAGSGAKRQTTILPTESTPINLNASDNTGKISGDMIKHFENPKSPLNESLVDSQIFKNVRKLDECIFGARDGAITFGKQLVLTNVAVGLNVASQKQSHDTDDIEDEKVETKSGLSVDNNCDLKVENQELQMRNDKNESNLASHHDKRSEKKIRHHGRSKEKKRLSERVRKRSRSYRDSHRRSRSRGMKHRSRSRSHTSRDHSYRSSYRSQSRDRFHRHESSYYDCHSYRRYRTPDVKDRYRRRHSSSGDRSSRHERSTSRDLTPTADKSSRSHSYYDRSKSTESPLVSRQSSLERSVSQCKTMGSRDRSSSRLISPERDISRIAEHESEKSPRQPGLQFIDGAGKVHKSINHSLSPGSEKSLGKGLEIKTAKLKKHRKTKEKHKKRKKSHHKKKDRKKPSPCMTESELDEKCRASSVLSDETDLNMNTSFSQLTDEAGETFSCLQKELNDRKNERTKKKEKKKKKERRNTEGNDVTKKASHETLEDGEIITEKDLSPRIRKEVTYATSESEEEKDNTSESKRSDLVENCYIKGVFPTLKFEMNSKASEIATKLKEDFSNVEIRSSVLSFDLADEVLEVRTDNSSMSNLEKETRQIYELVNSKRESKITVDLEDDGISSKTKDSASDFNEITAREAEKLKSGNITEAMNRLKELRGYVNSKVTISKSSTGVEAIKQLKDASGNDCAFVGHSLADVPLPKSVQATVGVAGRVKQTATPGVRSPEACTSVRLDLKDRDVGRKKETFKRKWEDDEEDELSRLRYEALRSKTRRLMNDLKAERRRLKRERLRATIAMRRAREQSVDTSVDEILLADTSVSSETDDSEDYSSSNKRKLLKRKRCGEREAVTAHFNQNKLRESKQCINDDEDIKQQQKQQQNTVSSGSEKELGSYAPNNLILELQQRIGGSNESALVLLEQLKKCLTGGVVSSTIHVNPEMIRKNV